MWLIRQAFRKTARNVFLYGRTPIGTVRDWHSRQQLRRRKRLNALALDTLALSYGLRRAKPVKIVEPKPAPKPAKVHPPGWENRPIRRPYKGLNTP